MRLVSWRSRKLWDRLTGGIETLNRYFYYGIGFFQKRDDGYFQTARELTRDCIAALRRSTTAAGAELLVAIIPSRNQVDAEGWKQTLDAHESDYGELDRMFPSRLVRDYCDSMAIAVLDLTEEFLESESAVELYESDLHLSLMGHGFIAERLARFLSTESKRFGDPAVDLYRSGMGLLRGGRPEEAAAVFSAAINQNTAWAALHIKAGDAQRQLQNWSQAQRNYIMAGRLDPESPHAREGLAETFLALGDTAAGIEHYHGALALRPEWWPYNRRLANIYKAIGRNEEASQLEARVLAVFGGPHSERLAWWAEHRYESMDHFRREEWREAATDLRRAVPFATDDRRAAELHYALGHLYELDQRPDLARREYQVVPENTHHHRLALERLAALRD